MVWFTLTMFCFVNMTCWDLKHQKSASRFPHLGSLPGPCCRNVAFRQQVLDSLELGGENQLNFCGARWKTPWTYRFSLVDASEIRLHNYLIPTTPRVVGEYLLQKQPFVFPRSLRYRGISPWVLQTPWHLQRSTNTQQPRTTHIEGGTWKSSTGGNKGSSRTWR